MKQNQTTIIRNCARAVIIRDGAILLLHKQSPSYGTRYVLPGGAQDETETLKSALVRECQEELGTRVMVGDLLCVAENFKPKSTDQNLIKHSIEFLFLCEIPGNYVAANGPAPDKNQTDVFWLPLRDLATAPIFPVDLRQILTADTEKTPLYLGQIT